MSVDILLPCVRFEVVIHPGDPNQPTDLEAAALHFIQHMGERGTDFDQLEGFLALGKAAVAEMIIRFVNRGWVTIGGAATRLHLSPKAEVALDRSPEERGKELASTDEGRRFWLCYDIIGGGVATIQKQFLTKSGEDPRAVPRRIWKDNAKDRPYGRHIHGFLPSNSSGEDTEIRAWILRALLADRSARQYFRGQLDRHSLHVRILPPGRPLGIEEVWFFRCTFDVIPPPDGDEGDMPPILRCIETRNRQVRKLGELNSDAIIELAQAARQGGDERFWKTLKKHAVGDAFVRSVPADPLQTLREQLELAEKDSDFEELYELWEQVKERVASVAASRVDFDESRVTLAENLRPEIANAIDRARQRIVLSSPIVRATSAELSGSGEDTLSMLAGLSTGADAPHLTVHAIRSAAFHGQWASDETAIARLATALGSTRVHVVSNEQGHVRASFLLCDADTLLFCSSDLFGDQPVDGLLLRTAQVGASGTFGRMVADLPPELRDRIEAPFAAGPESTPNARVLPAEVVAALAEIEALLAHAKGIEEQDSDEYQQLVVDLDHQVAWLAHWIEAKSESVEVLVGQKIRDTAWRTLEGTADDEPLFVGIASRMDSRAAIELREAIGLRLSRQDLLGGDRAETVVCLPSLPEFDHVAMKFEEDFRPIVHKVKLLRAARRDRTGRPIGFIASPSTVVLAHDGLIQFRPTIGRRIKGTNLGLCLRGARARALALEFVRRSWPECAQALSTPNEIAHVDPSVSLVTERRKRELRRLAESQRWLDDGNRGAHHAQKSIVWSRVEVEVEELLAGGEQDKRLAYALAKAAAFAELKGHSERSGALGRLAERARDQGDLMTTSLLAEHLPLASIYRDPLVRKLAFCLARRRAPRLTPDELSQLTAPSTAVQALTSLLMLEGLGGELPNWIAHMEQPTGGSHLAAFTKALANYVQEDPGRSLDLSHVGAGPAGDRLISAIERLKVWTFYEFNRKLSQRAAKSVNAMHEALFRAKDAFVAKLHQLLNHDWPDLNEVKRRQRLIALVNGTGSDLQVDLIAAARLSAVKVNPNKLARDYYDRKHERMQQETGLDPVKIHLSGRYALRSLEEMFGTVIQDLVPALLGQTTPAEIALTETAREMLLSEGVTEPGTEVSWLFARVKDRLRRPEANTEIFSQPWILPRVPSVDDPDWPRLKSGFFESEFEKATSFHEVVEWFLGDYRDVGFDAQVVDEATSDRLLVLHELLEKLATEVEPNDLVRAEGILIERLKELASNARKQAKRVENLIDGAAALSAVNSMDAINPGSLTAVNLTTTIADQIDKAIRNADIVTAVLTSTDLPQAAQKLDLQHQEAVMAAQNALSKHSSEAEQAEIRRLLSVRTADATTIRGARRYLDLAPMFRQRRIEINTDLPLDIVDSREILDRVAGGAEGLVLAIASILPKGAGDLCNWSASDVSSAVCGFFSELDTAALLPLADLTNGIWRVRMFHPAVTSLALGDLREIEFLLPTSWNAESRLRDDHRGNSFATNLAGSLGSVLAGARPAQFGKTGRAQVLISIFYNVNLPGIPTLPWRRLAENAGLGVDDRRIAVMSTLAAQQIGSAESLTEWWQQLDADNKRKTERIAHLLGIQTEQLSIRISDAQLAKIAVDFCLIFRIGLADSRNGLSLSERCISALSRIWPKTEPDGSHDPITVTRLLKQIVSATFTNPQRRLDLGTPASFEAGSIAAE